MTNTPTPAQQLDEVRNAFKLAYSDVLQSHRLSGSEPTWDQCFDAGFAALMKTPLLRRALAALEAVEGWQKDMKRIRRDLQDMYDVMPSLPIFPEDCDSATDWMTRFCIEFNQELITQPADAVEVSRG